VRIHWIISYFSAKSHPFEEYHAKRNAQREEEARAKLNATKAAESHQQ
jgi:hypothetical protein